MKEIKFGTDGWRDIIADNFNFANLKIVINSIARYLCENNKNKNGIFIGYDNRFLSEDFAAFSAKILSAYNFKVYLSEKSVPTPVTAFNVRNLNLDGAIMITASHNPAKYNGIKFIPDYGGPATDLITAEIEQNISYFTKGDKSLLKSPENGPDENIVVLDDYPEYYEKIKEIVNFKLIGKADLKIAADMLFGAGINVFPKILDSLSTRETRVLNNKRDALFGGKLPDPSEKNLSELKKIVLEKRFDIGVSLDGDADRFGVIDLKGVFLNPNKVISIILYYLCSTKNNIENLKAVRTVATTHLIDEICRKYKIELIETPVGFKYIAAEMLKNNILIGGEESGGLSVLGHIPEKDGILANLLLIEIQSYLKTHFNNIALSEYLEKINEEFGYFYNTRIDLEVPREKMSFILSKFKEMENNSIESVKISNIFTEDGVKLLLENNSWVLLRLSGTEPLIRCYIESRDEKFFNIFKQYIITFINGLL